MGLVPTGNRILNSILAALGGAPFETVGGSDRLDPIRLPVVGLVHELGVVVSQRQGVTQQVLMDGHVVVAHLRLAYQTLVDFHGPLIFREQSGVSRQRATVLVFQVMQELPVLFGRELAA